MDKFIEVKTLLGHRNLDFSIACLSSFINKAAEKIRLIIFEDGTLTIEDKNQLKNVIEHCIVIDRGDCDAIVLQKLSSYPACLQYRKSTVYARKIFNFI